MNVPFPLRWKIFAWFVVNLAVLGLLIAGYLRAQFRFGVDSLLAGSAGDRLEAIAEPLTAELRRLPPAEWAGAIQRSTAAYGVRAAVFRNDGGFIAGEFRELPREVREFLTENQRRTAPLRPGPPDRPPPPDYPDGYPWPPPHPEPLPATPYPKFMLHTTAPSAYWAGVRLGVEQPPRPPFIPRLPVTLLIASGSLRGGGLFFDPLPVLALGAVLLLVSAALWVPFIHDLNRTLARMTAAAEQIAQGQFQAEVGTTRRDELGRLGAALQHMAARLEGFVTGQKRFLGDTAHELLSPLARLEVALSILEQRGNEATHAYTEKALGDIRAMSRLVQDLLSFSKAGLRTEPVAVRAVPLAALARDVVARESNGAEVIVEIDEQLHALAEPELLGRAIGNAVRNAVRYAGDAGPIIVSAQAQREQVVIAIADNGPGVPPETLGRLFDPFFRPEASRSRDTGGSGLGLAIVKSCVEACGGTVALKNCTPHGLQLDITLPRAAGL